MKKIGFHGRKVKEESHCYILRFIESLKKRNTEVFFTSKFFTSNKELLSEKGKVIEKISSEIDLMISFGGDGTFLDTVLFVEGSENPILGINIGNLGFLALISTDMIDECMHQLFNQEYTVEQRSLIKITSPSNLFQEKSFALNECAIVRKNTTSMIMIKSYLDDQYLNNYWADGLIISTPTGSTGYSLSCGGPLMMPNAKNLVITPISPHNLNVRPLIVSEDSEIKIQIEREDNEIMVSLDSRSESVNKTEFLIKKAPFSAHYLRPKGHSFIDTIRAKLGWGFDKRN